MAAIFSSVRSSQRTNGNDQPGGRGQRTTRSGVTTTSTWMSCAVVGTTPTSRTCNAWTVVTTVHERQVLGAGTVPTTAHDIHVDVIVTPERIVRCARPSRWALPELRWDELTDEKIAAIPLLTRMRRGRAPRSSG